MILYRNSGAHAPTPWLDAGARSMRGPYGVIASASVDDEPLGWPGDDAGWCDLGDGWSACLVGDADLSRYGRRKVSDGVRPDRVVLSDGTAATALPVRDAADGVYWLPQVLNEDGEPALTMRTGAIPGCPGMYGAIATPLQQSLIEAATEMRAGMEDAYAARDEGGAVLSFHASAEALGKLIAASHHAHPVAVLSLGLVDESVLCGAILACCGLLLPGEE